MGVAAYSLRRLGGRGYPPHRLGRAGPACPGRRYTPTAMTRVQALARVPSRGRAAAALMAALLLAAIGCARGPRLPALAPGDVVVAFGDSLTYGTGAGPGDAYPAVLATLIGRPVVGAGVPGETTAAALRRLPAVLARHRPRLLLLCTGGNDLLRRVDPAATEANLRRMVSLATAQGAAVVLIAVPAAPLARGIPYAAVARDLGLPIEDRVLGTVLFDDALKSDALHPNAAGYRRMAEAVAAVLRRSGAI
jgi:acyl-CoA thioesterase-1